VWRTNFETSKRELEVQENVNHEQNIQIRNTITKVADYIENHRNKIFRVSVASNAFQFSLAKRSAILSLEGGDGGSGRGWLDSRTVLIEKLNQSVEELHSLTGMFIVQYEHLADEKLRALGVLRAAKGSSSKEDGGMLSEKNEKTVRLDVELVTLVQKVKIQLNGSQIKVKELEHKSRISEERKRVVERECEEEVKRKENTIRCVAQQGL